MSARGLIALTAGVFVLVMANLKIETASNGKLMVSLTRFGDAELARMKKSMAHGGI